MAKRKLRTSRGQKPERGSVVVEILRTIIGDADALMSSIERPWEFKGAVIAGVSQDTWREMRNDARQRRALNDMKRKKWLQDRKQGNKIIVTLSRDAIASTLKTRIKGTKKLLPKGEQCLVLFDFPMGAGSARSFWRRFLAMSDFTRVQLSVWGTDKDVVKDVTLLVGLLEAGKWVKVYRTYPR